MASLSLSTFWEWEMTEQDKESVSREDSVSDSFSDLSHSPGWWVPATLDFERPPGCGHQYPMIEEGRRNTDLDVLNKQPLS